MEELSPLVFFHHDQLGGFPEKEGTINWDPGLPS